MDRAARLPDLVFELDSIDEEHNGVIVGAALRGRPSFALTLFVRRAATEGRPYN
jgi:hypothetical protein